MKNKLKQGILRRNAKGFGFVKIEEEEKEYHISEKNLKNALNGDEDVKKILEKSKKNNLQDEAKVVSIIKHERDTIVGTYQSNKNFGFVVPDDLSFGTDIFISKKKRNKAKNNQISRKKQKCRRKNNRNNRAYKSSRSGHAIISKRVQLTI